LRDVAEGSVSRTSPGNATIATTFGDACAAVWCRPDIAHDFFAQHAIALHFIAHVAPQQLRLPNGSAASVARATSDSNTTATVRRTAEC
jgi:hypothetical protein